MSVATANAQDVERKAVTKDSGAQEQPVAAEKPGSPAKSPRSPSAGQDAAKGGEHDGSSSVDMTEAQTRGPVGPTKNPPETRKQ